MKWLQRLSRRRWLWQFSLRAERRTGWSRRRRRSLSDANLMSFAQTKAHEENPRNLRGLLPNKVTQRQLHSERKSVLKPSSNAVQGKHLELVRRLTRTLRTEVRWSAKDTVEVKLLLQVCLFGSALQSILIQFYLFPRRTAPLTID